MSRESGYYWVKHKEDENSQVAFCVGTTWILVGDDNTYKDSDLFKIDERRILTPDERDNEELEAKSIAELY